MFICWLDQEHTWKVDGQVLPVKCEVQRFDFSAHIARSDIQRAILAADPRILIFNHGSPEAIEALRQWAETSTRATVYVPHVGDEIDIDDGTSALKAYTEDDGYAFPEEQVRGESRPPAVENDE